MRLWIVVVALSLCVPVSFCVAGDTPARTGGAKTPAPGKGPRRVAVRQQAPRVSTDPVSAFATFCEEWMRKLVAREQDNVKHMTWDKTSEGVQGTYVGYSQDHTCNTRDSGGVPVGRITYTEFRYVKQGSSEIEAQQNPPLPVERVQVTEIFRYQGGKWVW